jgi:hypothetical protein
VSEFEGGLGKRPPVVFKPEIVNTTTKLLKIEPKNIIKAPKIAPFFMEFQNNNSAASASGFALDSSIQRTPMRYNELSSNEEVKPSLAPIKPEKNPSQVFAEINLENGDHYFGQISNGNIDGIGEYIFSPQNPVFKHYKPNFHLGQRRGHGQLSYCDGSTYIANFCSDLKHGKGEYTQISGNTYHGDFHLDQRQGPAVSSGPTATSTPVNSTPTRETAPASTPKSTAPVTTAPPKTASNTALGRPSTPPATSTPAPTPTTSATATEPSLSPTATHSLAPSKTTYLTAPATSYGQILIGILVTSIRIGKRGLGSIGLVGR